MCVIDKDKITGGFAPELATTIIEILKKYGVEKANIKLKFQDDYLSINDSRFEGSESNREFSGGIHCSFQADKLTNK